MASLQCGMILGMQAPEWWKPQEPHWQRTAVVVSVVLSLVGTLVAVLLAYNSPGAVGPGSQLAPTTPNSPLVSKVPPTLVPMSSPATSTSTLTSSAPPAPESDYLFDLTPIDGAYEVGSKSVNGQTFGRSIFHGLSECNSGEGYSVEYDIGRQYSTFTATAGLSDLDTRGARTVQFRIDTDRGHDYFTSGRGESHKVSFDIRGSLFLRLTVYEPNGSGPCIVDTVAVWGDAQIHH
jgi:NPCBM/NEW2 domain